MELFLTSNIGGIKKENGNELPTKFDNKNNFVDNLKLRIKNYDKFVFIASNPDDYEINDFYFNIDVNALNLSGLKFRENVILDSRSSNNIEKILKNSSLIILSGGYTYGQNKFFNNINLKKYLKDIDACIVGISAGTINCADEVFNSPEFEEYIDDPIILKGLGLTNINVEPHYNKEKLKLQEDIIIKESLNRKIYRLEDGAYILNNKIYGNCYLVDKGITSKICNDNEVIEIK